ncbi:peptidase [Clostridia bacterium]|nr:peptidase [Clostridia bacterium]
MSYKGKTSSITKGLYVILAICVISITVLCLYSLFTQDNLSGQSSELNNRATNNVAENDGPADNALFEFLNPNKNKTTESATVPSTERVTVPPTARTTVPPLTESPPAIPESDTRFAIEDEALSGANEYDAAPVLAVPKVFTRPAAGPVAKRYNPDELEYSVAMNDYRTHDGIYIESEVGVLVKSVTDGHVEAVGDDPLMGTFVVIDHGEGLKSYYMNLQPEIPQNVTVGMAVKGGEVIGGVGETALTEVSDVTHLHFAMKLNGASVDPGDYITF